MRKRKSAVVSTLPPAAAAATRAGLADRVYDILRSQIFARQLIAGSKLNIDQIARELAVSATPVPCFDSSHRFLWWGPSPIAHV